VDVESGSHHPRPAPTGGAGIEADERVALDADGLAEQPIGQGVARLAAAGGRRVEQLDGTAR